MYQYLKKTFCDFSMSSNQYLAGRVYDLYVYFMMGTPKGSMESSFMEKLGIKPATPGLQDIGISPTPRWLLILMGNTSTKMIDLKMVL